MEKWMLQNCTIIQNYSTTYLTTIKPINEQVTIVIPLKAIT